MAKKTHDPESATTQVNIADFQRTRDSHISHASCFIAFAMPSSSGLVNINAERIEFGHLLNRASIRCVEVLTEDLAVLGESIREVRNDPIPFTHTYPQVIVALATLQSSVQDLSRAYIQHANTVLTPGKHGLNPIDANLTSILTESGLLSARPADAAPAAAPEPELDGKKKRKRTPHDPNAPKRALTPYFLYMQSARATIAKELGDSAKPKEVADEGTRRWTEMSPAEKSIWDDKYQKNLAAYRVKMAAYKAGQPVPDDETAARLVEMGKAPEHIAGMDAEAETEEEPVEEEEEEEEEEVPAPEPTPPKSKRRKTKDAEPTPSKATPKAEAKSPEKDRKSKKSRREAAAPASTKPEKSKKSKK